MVWVASLIISTVLMTTIDCAEIHPVIKDTSVISPGWVKEVPPTCLPGQLQQPHQRTPQTCLVARSLVGKPSTHADKHTCSSLHDRGMLLDALPGEGEATGFKRRFKPFLREDRGWHKPNKSKKCHPD